MFHARIAFKTLPLSYVAVFAHDADIAFRAHEVVHPCARGANPRDEAPFGVMAYTRGRRRKRKLSRMSRFPESARKATFFRGNQMSTKIGRAGGRSRPALQVGGLHRRREPLPS